MKRLIFLMLALLVAGSASAATKVQVMTDGVIDVDRLPTISFFQETDPASPALGQLWWNNATNQLKVAGALGVYAFNSTSIVNWDTTPEAFSFTDVTNATTSTVYTSAPITVSGINWPAAISVSGDASAKYSVNNATAVSTNGTVASGDEVRAVVTSSASDGTAVNATVTIGGVSDAFGVTTAGSSLIASDDFSTDTLSNYTQLHSTTSVVYDSANQRMRGGGDNANSGVYYNTPVATDNYYVSARLGVHTSYGVAGRLVFQGSGSGSNSTGYYVQPVDSGGMILYKFSTDISRVSVSNYNFPAGKTWAISTAKNVRVEVRDNNFKLYVDWDDDGSFDGTDEYIGEKTDSSYSGRYGGFSFYGYFSAAYIDDFDMGDL